MPHRHSTVLAASLSGLLLASCAPAHTVDAPPDPPDTPEDVAVHTLETYSRAVEGLDPMELATVNGAPCWYCSYESIILDIALEVGADSDGGGFTDIHVISSDEVTLSVHEVVLTAHREGMTFVTTTRDVVGDIPTADYTVCVRIRHVVGGDWFVESMDLEHEPPVVVG